jgi:hypothetical protein
MPTDPPPPLPTASAPEGEDPLEDYRYPRRSARAPQSPPEVIYTPEFKRWFGDWEDPEASHSVIVDERGRPRVLYHGTLLGTDAEIEELRSGDVGFSNRLGTHLAFDNRATDAFTVGREARKTTPDYTRGTAPGDVAMKRIKEGGRIIPVFANVRSPLDLASGFEPLNITAEEAQSLRHPHDDSIVRNAFAYLALEADPGFADVIALNRPEEEVRRQAEEAIRETQAGEGALFDEVPPGGENAFIAANHGATLFSSEEVGDRAMRTVRREYGYDGLLYYNTSPSEVTREEIDPLTLIVFDPSRDIKSIYATDFTSFGLGVRGNPPLLGPRANEDFPDRLSGPVSVEPISDATSAPEKAQSAMPQDANSSTSGSASTARPNERLEERLARQNQDGPGGDGAPTSTSGGGSGRKNSSEEPLPQEESAHAEPRKNPDREDLVGLTRKVERLRTALNEKREKIIREVGEDGFSEVAGALPGIYDGLKRSAEEIGVSYEEVKREVGLEETVPKAEPTPQGPFGFEEGSFDKNFYLDGGESPEEAEGHLAIHTSESGADLMEFDVEDDSITASISKQVTEALRPDRPGDLEMTGRVETWNRRGNRWEVALGEPYGLDLHIKFEETGLPVESGYVIHQVGATTTGGFARFIVDLARELAPSLEEVDTDDVQWRVGDFARALIRRGVREGSVPEAYMSPRPPQTYALKRPTEPGADPTIARRSGGVFGAVDDGPLPDKEIERAKTRARQTGIKTAIFVGHGLSSFGQPQEVTRLVVGEKDLKSEPTYRHEPNRISILHSRSPQTISMVADEDRSEGHHRERSADAAREFVEGRSDLEKRRVFPVQVPKGETIDTFYRWHEPTKPEDAVDAESEEDLGFPSGETVEASRADLERDFRPSDIGGEEFEGVEQDVDLNGREPLELTPEERREANREAVSIITSKEPKEITEEDRSVLLEYTGAGGLGRDTGGASIRGERTEHYTDYRLIEAMWSAMENLGQEGNILEPGAGIGNFAGLRPSEQEGFMVMVESSSTTADILEVLYPEQQTLHRNLATVNLRPYQIQGAIGNVPFADTRIHTKNDPVTEGLRTEPQIHDYFLLRSLFEVKPGGIVMLITSTQTADRQNAELRRAMVRGADDPEAPMSNHRAAFLGGFRLPSEAFESSASTSVTTDVLAFQKLPGGMALEDLPEEIFERTNAFADNPATRTDVLQADRSQAPEEARELAQEVEQAEERLGEIRKREQSLRERVSDLTKRRKEVEWRSEEYNELTSERSDARSELRDVEKRKREAKRELDRLEGQLEDADGQRVTAHLNRFFDENPEFILGDLKFGYKRPALDLFGVEGDLEEAVGEIASFDPDLPAEPARPKAIFAEGTGQRLGIERQHPDGAIVFREGTFYESQPVGYDPISIEEELEEKARSAVDILETYEAFTRALARESVETETVRATLKAKLRNHQRRFTVPGDDPDLMEKVFRYDPRRPTLAALMEVNEVGEPQFADVLDFTGWYRSDTKSGIEDDENLEAISQFLRAQGESLTAESYARFYKGGALGVGEMKDLLEESPKFYFIPEVGPVQVDTLSEEKIDSVLNHVDLEEIGEDRAAKGVVAERAADAYMEREGSYMPEVLFTSGEIWTRIDLFEAIRERATDPEVEDRISDILEMLREALPEQKEYWDIAIDPRHYRSWLPTQIVQQWIEYELGYDTEIEWVDAPNNPEDRELILRYRNNGKLVSGISDDFSQEDESRGWHGIPYSNILWRYLVGNHFPIKHAGKEYVDPETKEPISGVTTKEEAKERGIHAENKAIQAENETEMRETMRSDFEEWADSADKEIRDRIANEYNRTYRSRAFPDFDGSTLNLPGFNFPKPIFEHNLAAAEKMVFNQGGGDNHSVGAGKTFASIVAIQTLRARGLVNKPMFVVPSQVIEKWMKEMQELFPDTNIIALRGKSDGLQEELQKARLFDYDAIFITQTGFKRLKLSPDARRQRITAQIERAEKIADRVERELESDFPAGIVDSVPDNIGDTIDEWSSDIERIQEEAAEEQVETLYLDEIGVDSFIFDEAHAYKNASAPSSRAQELGIVGSVSQRAVDTKTKVDWLWWKLGKDKNSFILTATPLENNPLEVWHMLQLCGRSVLERYGIKSLDAFIDLYLEIEDRIQRKVDGSFDAEELVTGFKNVTELQRVLNERLDIMSYDELIKFYTDPVEDGGLGLDPDEIPFGRPDATVHHDILEPSEIHEVLLEDIRLRADIIKEALGQNEKITDNYLSLTSDGGAMAEDLRIYQPAFWGYDGPGLKVDTIAEEVAEEYKRTGLPLDEKGNPIYPPTQTPSGAIEGVPGPPEARENPIRENPPGEKLPEATAGENPPTARENPRVITDRFGAPIGREPAPESSSREDEEERENPKDSTGAPRLGHTARYAARSNPSGSTEAFIDSLGVGDEVELDPDILPRSTSNETAEVHSFAPRNQIIFTSSASFKDGPFDLENPAEELPYVESVKRYQTDDMEPPLYVEFEDDSWLREIKRLLVEQGVEPGDIAIVSGTIIGLEEGPDGKMRDRYIESDEDKNKAKAEVQAQFQRGEINVIIGTNAISEGMNLDRYTTALYHMDVPWKPSNVEQRNGRALRQGNIYREMDITFKLLERSFDNYRLKLVNNKQSWIEDVLYGDFDLSEGEDDTVRTGEDSGGQSQSMDYQEMMVATSESEIIKTFFKAVHDQAQLEPKKDRLQAERKTRKRKLRAAESEIEDWSEQLEIQRGEYSDVLGEEIPSTEELEEGIHYEANLRYNRGREWTGSVRMMVAGGRDFEFTGGAGLTGSNIGANSNVGTKLITARLPSGGSPKVQIQYGWSKRSLKDRTQKARSSETYLQRDINGIAANHEDWVDYWRADVRETVERKIREQVKEGLGEEESLDGENFPGENVPEVPEPLTIEALWSLFSDQNDNPLENMTYSGIKEMIGITPGGRFGPEECWQRWTPVIERGLAEGLLGYASTYQSLAREAISKIEGKIDSARNQRDLMEKSISEIEGDIEKTKERLREAEETIEDLRGEVNDELASRFRNRGHLYNFLNQIREEFGIENKIPKRIVGAEFGSDVEDDDEPDDDIITDATVEDVTEDGEGPLSVDEGTEGGQAQSETTPSSADAPETGEEFRRKLGGMLGKTAEDVTGSEIVDTAKDFIALVGTRQGTARQAREDLGVDPRAVLDEARGDPDFEDLELGADIRRITAEARGQVFSHPGSEYAKRIREPVPYLPTEQNRLRGIVAQGINEGGYIDEMVGVADPIGEDAFELWLFGFAQRQMRAGGRFRGSSPREVLSRLKERFGDFEPSMSVSEVMPSDVQIPVEPLGLVVPNGASLRAPGIENDGEGSDAPPPGFALMDGFMALAPRGSSKRWDDTHFIYADHWQFVMQALTTSNTGAVGAESVTMGLLPEEDRQFGRPTIYFSTPTGVQAFVKTAKSGDPAVEDFSSEPPTENIFPSSLPFGFADRENPSSENSSLGNSSRESPSRQSAPSPEESDRREMLPTRPIGEGRVRSNPGADPTDVANVDTDHALSYLARTEPGSFKVNVRASLEASASGEAAPDERAHEKQVRADEEEVHHIFTDPEGSLLLIVPGSRVEPTGVPEGVGEEAEEMHEEFTHYDADGESMVIDLPDSDPDGAEVVGHAEEIIYESDKVMREGDQKGELHTYVHEFDEGKRPVRQWEDVAVVDDVAVDGRGILN